MKTIYQKATIDLGEGIVAYAIAARRGQQATWEGDDVEAVGYILLPCQDGNRYYIPENLKFGVRVSVAGENMGGRWGTPVSESQLLGAADKALPCVYRSRVFTAPRWEVALGDALSWARGEIRILADALRARQIALEEAELDA